MSATKLFNSVTKKVMEAVNTVISNDTPDEKLEGYRTRLVNLGNEFEAVKEAMKKYSKMFQALSAAGKGINDELYSFYAGSSRVQSSLPIFTNSQKVIDAAVEKNMKEKMGWECLKQFDDWTEDCNKMRDKIKKTEDAQAEVRSVELKLQNLRKENEKRLQRGQRLTVQDENTLKTAEDLHRKYQTSLTKMKSSLDEQMTRFINDRHVQMDSIFVRFMELQLDTTQVMQNASLAFTPIIESYRRRYPLAVNNEGIVKPVPGTNISSPTNSSLNANSAPNGTNGNAANISSSNNSPVLNESKSATQPAKKHSNAPPPKVTKTKSKKHESDDEESDEEDDDEESDEESDDEYTEPVEKKPQLQVKIATPTANPISITDKKTPKVSASVHVPIASPTAVPVSAPPTITRSSTASPVPPAQPLPATTPSGSVMDILYFSNSSGSSSSTSSASTESSAKTPAPSKQNSLLDMFSTGSAPASSSASSTTSSSRKDSSLEFDFIASPTTRASSSAAASSASAVSPSSHSFDPLDGFALHSEPSSRNNTLKPQKSIPISQSHDDFDPLNPNKRSKLDDIDEGPSVSSSGLDSVDDVEKPQWLPGELTDDKKSMLDEKLNTWEYSNGQQKPIHTLLSTLSSILWPHSGWKAPNISELMDINGIKKWKMKASRSIHPDKQVNASPAQQYMSKRVFAAINSAFQKYSGQGQQGMVYY